MTSRHDDRSDSPIHPGASQPAPVEQVGDARRHGPSLSLADLRERPLAEHADLFETLHADLQTALADIDHG